MVFDIIIGRDEEEKKKWGNRGLIFLGKQYVKMGPVTSLSNNIWLDVAKSHVVFIVGKRGSGKCLAGDTLVALNDGSLCPIRELAEKTENIFALNHQLKITEAMKTDFFKRKTNKLLHIKFRSGKEIKLTPEHPLLTLEGWKEAKELDLGSRLATPRILPVFGNRSMPEHEIKILAYLMTERYAKKRMSFSNMDLAIVKDLEKALKDLHPELELTYLKKGHYKIDSKKIQRRIIRHYAKQNKIGQFSEKAFIECEKMPIRKLVEGAGLYNELLNEKQLPAAVLCLPKSQLALFLNRVFSCGGSIYKPSKNSDYWEISYSTSSEKLAKQMHHVLLRFGILSRLRSKSTKGKNKRFKSFEIVLDGENVAKFIQEIGFFGEKEKKQFLALQDLQNKKHNPNVDTVPREVWNFYKPLNSATRGRELGYAYPKAFRESARCFTTRQKPLQIAIVDNNERLKLLAESDIFWDEIVEIKELVGEFEVYDITVPELHNFIANDIIVHNSYTMGAISEGIADLPPEVKENISVILLDTMGIYWTMKYPNIRDEELLEQWKLKAKGLDVKIFTPVGYFKEFKEKGIPTDAPFSIRPSDLDADDWLMTFGMVRNSEEGVLLERIIYKLKKEMETFSIQDIIDAVQADKKSEQKTKDIVENHFLAAETWGLFEEKGTTMKELAKGGQVSILDLSAYATMPGGWEIKALALGLIAKKLFIERMISRKFEEYQMVREAVHYFAEEVKKKMEFPMVWLVVDEAHEFLPFEGRTVASQPLITILREGRQPGISLILASQQPGKIHTDVMTQSDTVIAHRLTAKLDVEALEALMQTYMRESLTQQLDNLPGVKGAAIIFDETAERMYPIRIRPRFSWHGGGAPVALKEEKKII